ncbi:MAG TPA: C-GCAxxG-C-C family protein, partial [Chloroflexota bacterium]|nr:C-GCAxxG-C-C family protein [Chloroflexota bacterium]
MTLSMELSVETAVAKARDLFDGGYSCAESTLQVLLEMYGLEDDGVWTAAAGFGGGVGRMQSVCGALAGGTIALGLLAGRKAGNRAETAVIVRPAVQRLVEGFESRFGNMNCGDLVVPFNFRKQGEYDRFKATNLRQERCHHYVKYVVEALASVP